MSFNFLDKLKFLVKTESFQRRPIKTIYRCFIILIYYILKVETKYQVNVNTSKNALKLAINLEMSTHPDA